MSRLIDRYTAEYSSEWLAGRLEAEYGRRKLKTALRGMGKYDKKIWDSRVFMLSELILSVLMGEDSPFRVPDEGESVYFFNGRYYSEVSKPRNFIQTLIELSLERLEVGFGYHSKVSEPIAKKVLDRLENTSRYVFRPTKRYVVFTNGVFDVKEGALRGFSPKYETEIVLDIPYVSPKQHYVDCEKKYGHSDNPCRLWETFIKQAMPNEQVRLAWQCFCGAMLLDRDKYKIEYMAVIYGPGANGKSVLVDAVKNVFGSKYITGFTPSELVGTGLQHQFNRTAVSRKLMNCTGDLDKADFSGGNFKRIVSNDADMQGRAPHSKEFIKVEFPLMVCCTNVFPDTSDDSEGYHRRLLPLASTTKVWTASERDPMLTHKLSTEDARIYIFSWIFEGCRRVMRENGVIPIGEDVMTAIKAVKANSNSMRRWWKDYSPYRLAEEGESGDWVPARELRLSYEHYCREYGELVCEDWRRVGLMLTSLGLTEQSGQKRKQNGCVMYHLVRRTDDER